MFLIALKGFFYSESGAVSVDFVVLTSLVLSFGITVATLVAAGVNPIASGLSVVVTPNSGFSAKFVSVDE